MRPAVGLFKPKHEIPGLIWPGRSKRLAASVEQFQPGDEVFGWCNGAFAEYACVEENNLLAKPSNLTLEQSAAVGDSAFTALNAVRDQGKVQPGQKVMINGASGGVGTFAVQIAKSFGADVTGVCSTRNAEMVRSIGADRVIDYTQEDFAQDGQRYDVMLDLVGNRSLSDCRRRLAARGPTSWSACRTLTAGSDSLARSSCSRCHRSCARDARVHRQAQPERIWLC